MLSCLCIHDLVQNHTTQGARPSSAFPQTQSRLWKCCKCQITSAVKWQLEKTVTAKSTLQVIGDMMKVENPDAYDTCRNTRDGTQETPSETNAQNDQCSECNRHMLAAASMQKKHVIESSKPHMPGCHAFLELALKSRWGWWHLCFALSDVRPCEGS